MYGIKCKKIYAVLSVILATVVSLATTCLLAGCNKRYLQDPWDVKQEEDGWYYYINKYKDGRKYAAILGLVDNDMECDELVVPEKLGGCNVEVFGVSYSNFGVPTKYYKFNAKKVRCLIFNHKVSILTEVFDNYNGTAIFNFNISLDPFFDIMKKRFYRYYIDYDGMGGALTTYALFWYRERLIPKPEDPTREGYIFDGWHTDSECTVEWDFENDLVPDDMTLYAKWIEN